MYIITQFLPKAPPGAVLSGCRKYPKTKKEGRGFDSPSLLLTTHPTNDKEGGQPPSFDEPPGYGSNLIDGTRIDYGSFGLARNFIGTLRG